MKLQILICTHGPQGLERVASRALPRMADAAYLVSCQSEPMPVPPVLQRDDIKVAFTPTKGLSNNRNHALRLATAEYVLIADDDQDFYADAIGRALSMMDTYPQVGIAGFRYDKPHGKRYPEAEQDLYAPYKGYYWSSIELMLRLEAVRKHGLRFSPEMGLGAPRLQSGEEGALVLSARKAGIEGRYFPLTLSRHLGVSTGEGRQSDPGVLRSEGALIALRYGATKYPRLLLKAKRTRGGFFRNLRYLLQGWAYATKHPGRLLQVGRGDDDVE